MPVRRYREISQVPQGARSGSALEGIAAACAASQYSRIFGHTKSAPRGVYRFRTIEDADAHRQQWESSAGGTTSS